MVTSTQVQLVLPRSRPLLPPELVWLYPIAPIPAAVILVDDLFSGTVDATVERLVSIYVPFVALSAFFNILYRAVMPGWLNRAGTRARRTLVNVLVVVLGATGVSLLLVPLLSPWCDDAARQPHFTFTSIVISSIFVFPALAVQRWRNHARDVEQLAMAERQAALEAQLVALQSRTNPHFFFNSINTVASLIPEDPRLAERTLERLADLFRYALDAGKIRTVPLEREMAMVRDYLEIQAARFGERLESTVTMDPEVATADVPPLLLQPLVENAILHGLNTRARGKVEVVARQEGGSLVITVTDDGPGPGASPHHGTRTSVADIGQRLKLSFGDAARFSLSEAPGGGCLAFLSVPLPA